MKMLAYILGTAQDGGVPHMGCGCSRCRRARADRMAGRYPSSLALVTPEKRIFLLDATPRMPEQLDLLAAASGVTPSEPDGILLTHAHIGHYAGLMYLGKEVMSGRNVPVYCTPSMASFLSEHSPWRDLIDGGNIELQILTPGEPFTLEAGVRVTAFCVPHRDERSDTVGYLVEGDRAGLLYMPDLDAWEGFEETFNGLIRRASYALIDGTFFSEDELMHSGRRLHEVPHPPVSETLRSFEIGTLQVGTAEILFTHFNHTNPLLDDERTRSAVLRRGFGLAAEGQVLSI